MDRTTLVSYLSQNLIHLAADVGGYSSIMTGHRPQCIELHTEYQLHKHFPQDNMNKQKPKSLSSFFRCQKTYDLNITRLNFDVCFFLFPAQVSSLTSSWFTLGILVSWSRDLKYLVYPWPSVAIPKRKMIIFQPSLGGGNSNIFGIFIPEIGEDEPILTFIFFLMGWFNHQLASIFQQTYLSCQGGGLMILFKNYLDSF